MALKGPHEARPLMPVVRPQRIEMKIRNWPYWLKGMLFPILVLFVTIIVGGLSILLGLGTQFQVLSWIGFIIMNVLSTLSIYVGGAIAEILNYALPIEIKVSEGGGSPTLEVQLITIVAFIIVGGIIGCFYGKIKIRSE
jgi:hypothetical protein